jgi:hypothetical protein
VAISARLTVLATTASEEMAAGLLYMAKIARLSLLTSLGTEEEFTGCLAMIVSTSIAFVASALPSYVATRFAF